MQESPGYYGKRLYLSKVREEENSEIISEITRREPSKAPAEDRFLVFFKIDDVLPLIGGD
jgi:hypothetical protein